MEVVKKFLGKNQEISSVDETLFNKLFFIGANKDLLVIKSKIPLPYQDISDQHTHDNFEFTIPLSHSPRLLIDSKEFRLPRRNIFPSNPGQFHGPAEVARQHRIIVFQMSPNRIQEIAASLFLDKSKINFHNSPTPIDFHIEPLIEMFIDESNNKQAGYEFILDNLSSLLGVKLLRELKSNLYLREKPLNHSSKKDINRAIEYLHANINQDFSLADLAEITGFSKYYFMRVFKNETGKTPYRYYTDIKIEKAIELLKTNKYSITDICFFCGFKDHSHFSKVFKSKTGMTPSSFNTLCQ